MDGWVDVVWIVDEWVMGRWMDKWVEGWMKDYMDGRRMNNGWMARWTDVGTDAWGGGRGVGG